MSADLSANLTEPAHHARRLQHIQKLFPDRKVAELCLMQSRSSVGQEGVDASLDHVTGGEES